MMFVRCMLPLMCVLYQHDIEQAKETLFTEWSTSSTIAMVTVGLPTDEEKQQVLSLVEDVQSKVAIATAGDLPEDVRQLDVPFLLGMLDGIVMPVDHGRVSQCLTNLATLDDAVSGIAASRLWRMRLVAAMIMKDEEAVEIATDAIRNAEEIDAEDRMVLAIYDINSAFQRHDIATAKKLYQEADARLVQAGAMHLRNPLAAGYARVATIPKIRAFGWFQLAEWYKSHGVQQQEIDRFLMTQFHRLPEDQMRVMLRSKDETMESFSTRLQVAENLSAGNIDDASRQLMQLAQDGDIAAAEQLLMLDEAIDMPMWEEALSIVRAHPSQTVTPVEYWCILAATREMRMGNKVGALEWLGKVDTTSAYSGEARKMEQQLNPSDAQDILARLESSAPGDISKLVRQFVVDDPTIVRRLLLACIDRWHAIGDVNDPWLRSTVQALLREDLTGLPGTIAEAHRLLGNDERAAELFAKAIEIDDQTIQTLAGLADCSRDYDAMRRVIRNTSPTKGSYWYWLANLRIVQWFLEDGGDRTEVIAKINRLRLEDETLGGPSFLARFNEIYQSH